MTRDGGRDNLSALLLDDMRAEERDLAKLTSLARRVSPQYLRRIRLVLRPDYDVGAEARLWNSPIVHDSHPDGFAIMPEVRHQLRRELFANAAEALRCHRLLLAAQPASDPLDRLEAQMAYRGGLLDRRARDRSQWLRRSLSAVLRQVVEGKPDKAAARWAVRVRRCRPRSSNSANTGYCSTRR